MNSYSSKKAYYGTLQKSKEELKCFFNVNTMHGCQRQLD